MSEGSVPRAWVVISVEKDLLLFDNPAKHLSVRFSYLTAKTETKKLMANSDSTQTPLDENTLDDNILTRLDQIDRDAVSARISSGSFWLPESPINERSVPLISLNQPVAPVKTDQRNFLESDASDITRTAGHRINCHQTEVWISGNSLLCACPDCDAPMTIRYWLRLADCWRCDASVSLSEQQIRAVEELLEPTQVQTEHVRAVPTQPAAATLASFAPNVRRPKVAPTTDVLPPPPAPIANEAYDRELERLSRGSFATRLIRGGFKLTPAWIVSLVLHLIVILILALIVLTDRSFVPESITLSTFLDSNDRAGGDVRFENIEDMLQDDLIMANHLDVDSEELREVLQKANQDAKQLQVDPRPLAPLPDLNRVKKNITTRSGPLMSFAARDPRVRSEIVRSQGGTTVTEAAVSRGLRWLSSVQNQDGGWSLRDYHRHAKPDNKSDIMGTSLALLPMLGAGQTHEYGAYKECIGRGLAWLIDVQKPNGDLRGGFDGEAGMYAHGQAAIVLCEALALTGDQTFLQPAQRAIKFIELAQHKDGGWRYRPGQPGDTSVFGWQMMALQSARAPGLDIELDDSTLKLADYFLDQVVAPAKFDNRRKTELPAGSAYSYQPRRKATQAMTAEAILCRMYLGWKKDDPRLSSAVKWLIEDHLPSDENPNLYYWYYGTQVMHHYGGKPWKKWNDSMRNLLISSQETRGSNPGSWNPKGYKWGSKGGRIYTTSLAVCTLEVYYRHLPLFKQIDLE